MVHESLIDKLVPQIEPSRQAALIAFNRKTVSAAGTIDNLYDLMAALVERLARIDVRQLQPRMAPEYFSTAARLHRDALDLRQEFDNITPTDLHDAVRAARASVTDADFSSALHVVEREAGRYVGKAAHVKRLAESIQKDLAALEAAGSSIWSDVFVPTPAPSGFITQYGSAPSPATTAASPAA